MFFFSKFEAFTPWMTIVDPDQPANPCLLIRIYTVHFLKLPTEFERNKCRTGQTARMYRLIWIYSGSLRNSKPYPSE
jgi:hypothetical protein